MSSGRWISQRARFEPLNLLGKSQEDLHKKRKQARSTLDKKESERNLETKNVGPKNTHEGELERQIRDHNAQLESARAQLSAAQKQIEDLNAQISRISLEQKKVLGEFKRSEMDRAEVWRSVEGVKSAPDTGHEMLPGHHLSTMEDLERHFRS